MGKKRKIRTRGKRTRRNGKVSAGSSRAVIALFLLLASAWTAALYYQSLSGPFIFDDRPNIELNTSISWGAQTSGNFDAPVFDNPNSNRPIVYTSFAINHFLHGYEVRGYRVTNLIIHLLNGIALYLLVMTTYRTPALVGKKYPAREVAAMAALLFLVHPVAVQSVAYVVQRMTSLATLFYLLSLLCYANARLVKKHKKMLYAGSLVAAVLAIGSKEISATLPIILMLYEFYFLQDLEWNHLRGHFWKIAAGLFVFILVAFLFLGSDPLDIVLSGYESRNFTLGERMLTELRVVVYYLTLFIFPHAGRLNLDYNFALSTSLFDPVSTILSLLALSGLVGLAVYTARGQRILSFAIWWFLINLVIESSVIPLEIAYEHRTYLPFIMLFFACVVFLTQYMRNEKLRRAIIGVFVVLLSFWTYERAGVWSDDVLLWQDVVKKSPDKARPHHNLGVALREKSRYVEAIPHFEETLRIDPKHVNGRQNLGDSFMKIGQATPALKQFKLILELDPSKAKAHLGMGNALYALGRTDESIDAYEEYLLFAPQNTIVHAKLGIALAEVGREAESIKHFRIVVDLDPGDVDARRNLAVLLFNSGGDIELTAELLMQAANMEPRNADVWADLAIVLRKAGRKEEAATALQRSKLLGLDSDVERPLSRGVIGSP